MRLHPGNGIWEIFIPDVGHGDKYKFEMLDKAGKLLPFKSDPVGQFHEPPPGNASIVFRSTYRWRDSDWMSQRDMHPRLDQPVSIYEVHLGSWRRRPADGNRYLSWALTEAAQLGRRYNEQFRGYYNRKVAQANTSLATKALGNKLARICYYIMRDQVPFREELIAH